MQTTAEVAYKLWEDAGCPQCDGKEFWYKAEAIVAERCNKGILTKYGRKLLAQAAMWYGRQVGKTTIKISPLPNYQHKLGQ